MCRDLALRGSCPRATNCTFAHSDLELDKYRSKSRKLSIRSSLPLTASPDPKTEKPIDVVHPPSAKSYKQCTEVYRAGKPYENNRRGNITQPIKESLKNFVSSLGNYVLPQQQQQQKQHLISHMGQGKNMEIQSPRYIMHGSSMDLVNPHVLDPTQSSPTSQNGKRQRSAKTLALLLQRRMEIISQLENVVGKPSSQQQQQHQQQQQQIKKSYDVQGNPLSTKYSIWTNAPQITSSALHLNYSNNYRRMDTMVFDDEFVPFETPPASKYGPISRLSKSLVRSSSGVQDTTIYGDALAQSVQTIGTPNPVASWYYGNQPYATVNAKGVVQNVGKSRLSEAYITPGHCNISEASPHFQLARQECMSKDLMLESQKVKQQLKHLERKINDLKLATQGAAFTEGERLTQELQMIEAGIREREKDVRNWCPYGGGTSIQQPDNNFVTNYGMSKEYKSEEDEDTYEAGIANDMRELELRWDFELQEQEKRWSSEEEGTKK